MKVSHIAVAAILASWAFGFQAAQAYSPGKTIVEEMEEYQSPNNVTKRPPHFTYMPNGTEYAMLSDDARRIETFDIKTGKKTGDLVDLGHVRETQVADMSGFIISPDASKVLIYRNVNYIYRRSFTAECYVYEVRSRIMLPLSDEHKKTQVPVFSPDSRMVAFVADNNVYVRKIDFKTVVPVTTDGKAGIIINGSTDWTYEEEFGITGTLAWSPDNTTLCYLKFDESRVPVYSLPLYEGTCERRPEYALYPGELSYKYPVAGQTNSTVTLHSYDIDTRKIKDIALPDATIEYIPRIDYGPSNLLYVSTLNRDQNRYELYSVNPQTTVVKSVLVEKSEAWITPETYEKIHFGKNGFVVMSNRNGHMHLYKYGYNGALQRTLTNGDFDVTDYYGEDALGNYYVQTATPTPLDRTVQKVDAKKGVLVPLTNGEGTSSANFSPDCSYAIYTFSSPTVAPQFRLCTAAGKELRMLEDNKAYMARFADKMIAKEFIQVPSDGLMLNGFIMRPRNFDPSKKYPVVMTQYSGPGSQSVLRNWEMGWMQYFCEKGFVVACVDGRGTAGRGNQFMYAVYKNLGHYETIDQVNAAKYLATLPGIDGSRIGMFGWSYGGYETLMCMTQPGSPFAAGVAVAPVTDWRFYDSIYTERYMLTPQQNDEGYNASAPLKRAKQLNANTLIMYGTADDNVHPVNSLQFASALQTAGMWCDMLVFPNKNHSIYGCGARSVVYGRMFDYFKKNLNL